MLVFREIDSFVSTHQKDDFCCQRTWNLRTCTEQKKVFVVTIFSHDNLLSLHFTLIKSAARLRGVHNGRRRKLFSVLSFYPDHQFFFDNLDGQGLQCWTFNFASHSVPISLVISHIRHDRAGETRIVLTLSIRRNFINLSID